jgi:hypothetical protein
MSINHDEINMSVLARSKGKNNYPPARSYTAFPRRLSFDLALKPLSRYRVVPLTPRAAKFIAAKPGKM